MLVVLMTCLILQTPPPGPLDGFRANFASIRAELDYDFQVGEFHDNGWRPWEEPLPEFVETRPDDRIVGHWACDGQAEYYLFSSPPDVLERARKEVPKQASGKVSYQVHFVPKTEFLWDGETVCWHLDNPNRLTSASNQQWKTVTVESIESKSRFSTTKGPLSWGFGAFPHALERRRGTVPDQYRIVKSGRPLNVEVYKEATSVNNGWSQLEVYYDPSVGFLPRFVRRLSHDGRVDRAFVLEFFLADARPCVAAGSYPLNGTIGSMWSMDSPRNSRSTNIMMILANYPHVWDLATTKLGA